MSLRLRRGSSPDERHAAWVRVAERIYDEQVRQGWRHRIFRLMRATFRNNASLASEGGFLFNWMSENYVDASLMVVRREVDTQAGTENLRNLLEDIIKHPEVLTRARYRSQWCGEEQSLADQAFDSFEPARIPGDAASDYIDPAAVRQDLQRALKDVKRVRDFAERTRAHRTPDQGVAASIAYDDLHEAIEDVRGLGGKYYSLLTGRSVMQWEPVPQYDTLAALMRPWVTDRQRVADEVKGTQQTNERVT